MSKLYAFIHLIPDLIQINVAFITALHYYLRMRMFHATNPENVASIMKEGLKPHFGELYLSDSVEGAVRWKIADVLAGNQISVIEVEVPKKLLREGADHSPTMQTQFKAGTSFTIAGGVAPWKIKKEHNCH